MSSYADGINFKDVFWNAPWKINDGCHFYSFPLGLLSIINFLTILGIFFLAGYVAYHQVIVDGVFNLGLAFVYGLGIILSGYLLNSFMFSIQAYLIKGCQCAKQNPEKK
jgi:hypothetical protein